SVLRMGRRLARGASWQGLRRGASRVPRRPRGAGRAARRERPRPLAGRLLEREPEVLEQLALEADAVGADPRREGEAEVGAREPARDEPRLEERLLEARGGEPLPPALDRLDVVEPAAHARHEVEVRLGAADDLLGA